MKYIITKTKPFEQYFGQSDPQFYCRDLYTLFDLSCIEITEPLFQTIYPLIPAGYEEISEDEAKYGSWFFSEIRETVKILDINSGMDYTDGFPETAKVLYTIPENIKVFVRNFMFRFAKEIIETEYNFRFKYLRDTSELEEASWSIQEHEAKEWLSFNGKDGHITPFLDYLALEQNINKTELANKILGKVEAWSDKLSKMLVEYKLLLNKFKNAKTIWDMNILFEKYFGIMVPAKQAQEMGLQDEYGVRLVSIDGEIYEDRNNASFGQKLNF